MKTVGFILGRESELCKAEIFSVLSKENYQIILNTKNILVLSEIKDEIKININKLGGTIKLFDVLGENLSKNDLQKFIQENISINQIEKRINFGISGYGRIDKNFIYSIGKKIKDSFVEQDLKARFVTGKFSDLTSVIVNENKLIERGFEAIIIENNGKYFVGQTIAVQDYKSYSKRDFGRTARDDKSGMLPPKLAQILINLGTKDSNYVLYDPFCGSGTVLQEAILMGYKKIYGSDISEKAIEDTKKNLEWLFNNRYSGLDPESLEILKQPARMDESIRSCGVHVDTFVSDILSPSRQIKADLIVGEGYLGEPNRRNVAQAKSDAKNLADFYLKAFSNLSKILNKEGRIVLALPYFIIGKEKVFLPIVEKLNLTGVKQVIIPDSLMTTRHTFTYARPDSFVGREIFILEKI